MLELNIVLNDREERIYQYLRLILSEDRFRKINQRKVAEELKLSQWAVSTGLKNLVTQRLIKIKGNYQSKQLILSSNVLSSEEGNLYRVTSLPDFKHIMESPQYSQWQCIWEAYLNPNVNPKNEMVPLNFSEIGKEFNVPSTTLEGLTKSLVDDYFLESEDDIPYKVYKIEDSLFEELQNDTEGDEKYNDIESDPEVAFENAKSISQEDLLPYYPLYKEFKKEINKVNYEPFWNILEGFFLDNIKNEWVSIEKIGESCENEFLVVNKTLNELVEKGYFEYENDSYRIKPTLFEIIVFKDLNENLLDRDEIKEPEWEDWDEAEDERKLDGKIIAEDMYKAAKFKEDVNRAFYKPLIPVWKQYFGFSIGGKSSWVNWKELTKLPNWQDIKILLGQFVRKGFVLTRTNGDYRIPKSLYDTINREYGENLFERKSTFDDDYIHKAITEVRVNSWKDKYHKLEKSYNDLKEQCCVQQGKIEAYEFLISNKISK